MPERETMPTDLPVDASETWVWMYPGMMPILQPALVYGSVCDSPEPVFGPGVMTPGQLGPTR